MQSRQIHLWPAVLIIAIEEQNPAQHFSTGAWLNRVTCDQPVLVKITVEQPGHTSECHNRGIAGFGDAILELIVAEFPRNEKPEVSGKLVACWPIYHHPVTFASIDFSQPYGRGIFHLLTA